MAGQQQTFFNRAAHRSSVRMGTAKVASPGIVVGVELNQRNGAELFVDGPQDRQQDRMVAADAKSARTCAENIIQLSGDTRESVVERKRIDRKIAIVSYSPFGKRI